MKNKYPEGNVSPRTRGTPVQNSHSDREIPIGIGKKSVIPGNYSHRFLSDVSVNEITGCQSGFWFARGTPVGNTWQTIAREPDIRAKSLKISLKREQGLFHCRNGNIIRQAGRDGPVTSALLRLILTTSSGPPRSPMIFGISAWLSRIKKPNWQERGSPVSRLRDGPDVECINELMPEYINKGSLTEMPANKIEVFIGRFPPKWESSA